MKYSCQAFESVAVLAGNGKPTCVLLFSHRTVHIYYTSPYVDFWNGARSHEHVGPFAEWSILTGCQSVSLFRLTNDPTDILVDCRSIVERFCWPQFRATRVDRSPRHAGLLVSELSIWTNIASQSEDCWLVSHLSSSRPNRS